MKEEKDILKNTIVSGFKKETPSIDFTDKVMQKIEHSLEHSTVVKPLISKKAWLIFFSVFGGLVFISFIIDSVQTIDFSYNKFIHSLKSIHWSDYKMTFKLFVSIVIILVVLSTSDLFYRKWKHTH
jgi:flagellar biosynthesis protein FliR